MNKQTNKQANTQNKKQVYGIALAYVGAYKSDHSDG